MYNQKFRVNMENLLSLMIVIGAFMSLLVVVAYISDVAACKFVKWLGLEGIEE